MINEIFGKHYTGNERIEFRHNEHFINQQDGDEQKRITDSSFTIVTEDGRKDKYIFECQSTEDGTMLVRIFEYITQEALDSGEVVNYHLTVTIPNAAVLFLRSTRNTPDVMKIIIKTPGGTVDFDVPIMKVKTYSLNEIFDKGLLFLLPFYIFNFEGQFPKYDKDNTKLKEEYTTLMDRLESEVKSGKISAYYWRTILEMSKRVLGSIASRYNNIQEGVNEIMGGKILDYPAKDILRQGIRQGVNEEKERVAVDMLRENLPIILIEKISKLSEVTIRNLASNLGITIV